MIPPPPPGARPPFRRPLGVVAGIATTVAVATALVIALLLLLEARHLPGPGFLLDPPSRLADRAGIGPALAGSLWLTLLTGLIALPVGVGTALYLVEYAPPTRTARATLAVLTNLAGVPSIVYGMAGLALFVRGLGLGPSILAGALTLSAMAIPIVIADSRAALLSLPRGLREAAFALGATRWQVVRHQLLPSAAPRILAGCRRALLRTMGAAAPLLVIGPVSFITFAPTSPADPLAALPTRIFAWSARPQAGFLALAAGASLALVLLSALLTAAIGALAPRTASHGDGPEAVRRTASGPG